MSLAQTAEQELFAASLHDVLSGAEIPAAARQWANGNPAAGLALWRKLADLGVTALAVPECHGGAGASLLDVMIACEELGHHALPGPVAESLAAVPSLLVALPEPAPAPDWLTRLAAGDLIATMALPPQLPYAADASVAGLVILAEGDAVWLATAGPSHRSVDPARALHDAGRGELLVRGPAVTAAATRALDAGALACAAQLLGAEIGRASCRERV